MLVLEKHNLLQASHHFFRLADSFSAAEKREGQDVSRSWRPCRACTMGLIALEWLKLSLVLFYFFCFSLYYLFDLHIFPFLVVRKGLYLKLVQVHKNMNVI